MAWLPQHRAPKRTDARPETTPAGFVGRLALMVGFALITPGFHLRSFATLAGAVGLIVAYGGASARGRLDAPCFSAWDEAVVLLSIAWLAYRAL
jgi:hypothetical protein